MPFLGNLQANHLQLYKNKTPQKTFFMLCDEVCNEDHFEGKAINTTEG